jgi:hypothetical protein
LFTSAPGPNARIQVRKAALNNANHFQVQFITMLGTFSGETGVDPADYGWTANEWVHIRITWDLTVGQGVPNTHIYFDGVEAPKYAPQSTGGASLGAEIPNLHMYIGAWNDVDVETASGIIDNFAIMDDVLPP